MKYEIKQRSKGQNKVTGEKEVVAVYTTCNINTNIHFVHFINSDIFVRHAFIRQGRTFFPETFKRWLISNTSDRGASLLFCCTKISPNPHQTD